MKKKPSYNPLPHRAINTALVALEDVHVHLERVALDPRRLGRREDRAAVAFRLGALQDGADGEAEIDALVSLFST